MHEVNFPSLVEDGFFQHRLASPMKTTMWGYLSSLVILYVCGWLGGVQCDLDQYSNKYQIRFLRQVLMDIYLISFVSVSVSVTREWRTDNHYLCLELRTTSRRGHGHYLTDSVYCVRYLLR